MNSHKNRKLDYMHLPSHIQHFCRYFVVFSYQAMLVSFKSRTMGVTNRAGITYPFRAPQFSLSGFSGGSCCSIFGFRCIVLSSIVLSPHPPPPLSFGHCITFYLQLLITPSIFLVHDHEPFIIIPQFQTLTMSV